MQENYELTERERLEDQIARLTEAVEAVSSADGDSPIFDWLCEVESVVEECEEILRSDDEFDPKNLEEDDFESLGIEAEHLSEVLNESEGILEESLDDDEPTSPSVEKSVNTLYLEIEKVQKQGWLLYRLLIRAA